MVFSSFIFLFVFLPVTVIGYFLTPRAWRNIFLLIASLFFYAWGAPQILPFLVLGCGIDFIAARSLFRISDNPRRRKWILGIAVSLNLGLLAYFKYANFFVEQVNTLRNAFGFSSLPWQSVLLPIGISFFTFHKISYLVDVYRRTVEPTRTFLDYLLYVILFPQLVAGPIIRYFDVAQQIRMRHETVRDVTEGFIRFINGLAKKILIADPLGNVADNVFALGSESLTSGYAWLGIICYSFQIFFDFAGYSDMAIGLGRIFGFRFRENFQDPYRSETFTEFWRRWHISLSSWMREYLYIPLGGNRYGTFRTYANLWIVFLLSGLWHGASWNFIFWGAYHGFFLVLDRLGWAKLSAALPRVFSVALTFFLVTIGWVFFRAPDLSSTEYFLSALFGMDHSFFEGRVFTPASIMDNRSMVVFVCAILLVFFLPQRFIQWWNQGEQKMFLVRGVFAICLLILATAALAARGHTPFLYFRF